VALIRAGFVNAHTHLYSALAPFGMPAPARAPLNFTEILEAVWWRLDRALDERALRASARWYVAEALRRGTTTLVDHHESPAFLEGSLDVLADACDELGMRAVLCYGATERNGGRDEARRGLDECERFVRANRRPHVRGLVGLHASFTVSDDTVREAGERARALGVPVHVHVAEDGADVSDARARGWNGPLERLRELGALPAGSVLAHGVHLGDAQVEAADAAGLWLVQNPRSNEHNGVGYAGALVASTHVALGTDGFPSDLREELAHLWRLARVHGDRASELALDDRLEASHAMAASFFPPGALDRDTVTLGDATPGERPPVLEVTVAGRTVVEEGRLVTGDLDTLRAEARATAPELWRRMEAIAWPA
jgi:cytosine/adenosine deaminase-related metal-dependent hydrolase